jgi:hypothetical protein
MVLALAACGSAAAPVDPPRGNLTLEQARELDRFPLYYAGDRVDGLPLVAVLRRNDTADYVSFVYGDCAPAVSGEGCAPPAEIQVAPGCARGLALYDTPVAGALVPEKTRVRGFPAAFFDGGTRLEIYMGSSTVVVFSDSRERVLRIAAALRPVEAASGVDGSDPGPLSAALDSRAGC